jgi:hypothetical protein
VSGAGEVTRRDPPGGSSPEGGLIIVQLDGVAEPVLRRALARGGAPTIERWLRRGSHSLVAWECGIPSQTSASQAGILFGSDFDIPGFRWFEKDRGRLMVSNRPSDAVRIERRLARGDGLLEGGGSSLGNLLSGGAPRVALTMSRLGSGFSRADSFYRYLANPGNLWDVTFGTIREVVVEIGQGWRQRFRRVRPRVARGGSYPFLRAAANTVLRDVTMDLLREDVMAAVPVVYCTFVGYDVVAHHAGPERPEALDVLRHLDRELAVIEAFCARAAQPYRVVVLSDHGQSQGAPFRQVAGETLEQRVQRLCHGERVRVPAGRGEGWGYLSGLLTQAAQGESTAARATRRFLEPRMAGPLVEVGPERERGRLPAPEIVVSPSGCLANIYLPLGQGRVSLEDIESAYPGLVAGLAGSEHIGFVMVRSDAQGTVVVGAGGVRRLSDGSVEGADPLADLGPGAADHLRELDGFPHCGDLVVHGGVDRRSGEVHAFEELVGSHGGLGGDQGHPFLLYPSDLSAPPEPLMGGPALHRVLSGWATTAMTGRSTDAPAEAGRR